LACKIRLCVGFVLELISAGSAYAVMASKVRGNSRAAEKTTFMKFSFAN
jgi:hypothetical protein